MNLNEKISEIVTKLNQIEEQFSTDGMGAKKMADEARDYLIEICTLALKSEHIVEVNVATIREILLKLSDSNIYYSVLMAWNIMIKTTAREKELSAIEDLIRPPEYRQFRAIIWCSLFYVIFPMSIVFYLSGLSGFSIGPLMVILGYEKLYRDQKEHEQIKLQYIKLKQDAVKKASCILGWKLHRINGECNFIFRHDAMPWDYLAICD